MKITVYIYSNKIVGVTTEYPASIVLGLTAHLYFVKRE